MAVGLFLGELPVRQVNISAGAGGSGENTSDATLNSSSQMLEGVTAYARGKKYTGNIPNKSAADISVSGPAVTVPAGNYAAEVKKSVPSVQAASPTVSVGADGLITASVSQGEGYVYADTKSAAMQLPTKGGETIMPATADQTIEAGQYLTGAQIIKGDANLKSENILSGKSIFGVPGGLVIRTCYVGSGDPPNTLGGDGDLYLDLGV